MYVSKNGEAILSEDDLDGHPEFFQCDTLMCPIVAKLNMLGYSTVASCQGHIYTHRIVDASTDGIPKLVSKQITMSDPPPYDDPYVMFDTNVLEIPKLNRLPKGWNIEYFVHIPTIYGIRTKIHTNPSMGEIERFRTFSYNIVLRLNLESLKISKDINNPYKFYETLSKLLNKFYKYVNKNLKKINNKE